MDTKQVKQDLDDGRFDNHPELAKNVIRILLDEVADVRSRSETALAILNTARCTTNASALFDIICQATGPLTPNAEVRGDARLIARRPSRWMGWPAATYEERMRRCR